MQYLCDIGAVMVRSLCDLTETQFFTQKSLLCIMYQLEEHVTYLVCEVELKKKYIYIIQ